MCFIRLNVTAQFDPVILNESFYAIRVGPLNINTIKGSMILVTKTSDQTGQRKHTLCVYVCVCNPSHCMSLVLVLPRGIKGSMMYVCLCVSVCLFV